jgi:multiple sugar transport system substrate-binding protein
MKTSLRRFAHRSLLGALVLAALGALALAPASSGATVVRDQTSILVWTDSLRALGFQQYQKLHPELKLKIISTTSDKMLLGIQLANRTGSGWPDITFNEPYFTAKFVSLGYSASLDHLVPAAVANNFARGSLGGCTYGGHLYCLRNDMADVVLWYNAKLMKQFGYTVPSTWEQFEAVGLRVAKEHPGYVVGSFGDFYSLEAYYWGTGCPLAQLQGMNQVRINTAAPECARMTTLIDKLLAAGALSKQDSFGTAYAKIGQQDKILMMPAASWYGEFLFRPVYKTPAGELAAAPPLRWSAEKVNWTGAQGGGVYSVSSHAKNLRAVADLAIWMATSKAFQLTQPTLPAYVPDAEIWGQAFAHDKYYASNPYPALEAGAGLIRSTWNYVRYNYHDAFTSVVLAAVQSGRTVASAMPAFQAHLTQLAQQEGYTVVNK